MVKTIYRKLKHIHMIGIGGTGMNGIAEVLLNLGYKVTGSDLRANEATARLAAAGRRDLSGHRPKTSAAPTSSSSPRPSGRTTSKSGKPGG